MPRIVRSLPLLVILCAAPAFAVFPDNGADTAFTSVGYIDNGGFGASAVAIDTRWILTAQHVGASYFRLEGYADFNIVETIEAPLINGNRPDLKLMRVDRDLPTFTRIDDRSAVGATVAIVGYGASGGETGGGFSTGGGQGVRRRANNLIEGTADISFDQSGEPYWSTLYYRLDAPNSPNRVAGEGGLAGGDSGGGFFANFGDGFRLVGTNSAVGSEFENGDPFVYGGYGFATQLNSPESLAFLRTYVPQAVVPEPASMVALGLGAVALLRRRKR